MGAGHDDHPPVRESLGGQPVEATDVVLGHRRAAYTRRAGLPAVRALARRLG
jgi:hypothetical protein